MTAETDRPDFKSPVDLALEADFALGASRISPSTREVLRGTERELLEPRVMQVLVALHQANGRVVSRDELIARCWEGRIVGEDAINRAIGRLRRLSEVDREASFAIETIPRVGYRLLSGLAAKAEAGPGSASADAEDGATSAPNVASASRLPILGRHRHLATALALLAVAVSAPATWLLWPAQHWTVESSRPFISTLALEGEPAFSPDGKMLAYMSGPNSVSNKIYVRNLAGGDAIKITNDTYNDQSPSWSSDGTHIAYSAQKPGEPCRIMIATVPAGEAREVGRCRRANRSWIAWQPNSSYLYVADQRDDGGPGVSRLDLDTGARRDIVKGNIRPLDISPDGKSLAYLAGESSDRVTLHVTVRDLTNGKERILGRIHATAFATWPNAVAWSADSKTLLVSDPSGSGSKIVAYPVDGSMPYPIYTSATGISYLSASVGGLLAIESHISRRNLARASPTPIAQPDIIDPANGLTSSPTFAPDGTLAFLSDRSGTRAIWITKPGTAPVSLYDAGGAALSRENFSPDGTRLAAVITTPNGVTIKILTADGASVASFDMPSLGLGLPTWTPDGKGLIVWDSRIHRAVRVDVADPRRRDPVAARDWQGVTIRSNGTFATREDKPGVWRIDNGPHLISSKYPVWAPPVAFLGDDVLIPDFAAASGPRILAQPLAGGPDRVLAYAPGAEGFAYQSKMAVNPKTGEIIYVATVQSDTNIDLLTLARR